jgi:succinate dehydrogenase / fumarate reductase, membrane anchor subunit
MSRNAFAWYMQRITGALLVPLLIAHFWVEHFMSATLMRGDLTYEVILSRISNPWWHAIDISFLLIALYHGLNGFYGIILDYGKIGPRAATATLVLIVAVGVGWAIWGIMAFHNL